MNAEQKKQLREGYKERLALGGVYAIDCKGSSRRLIKSTVDLGGIQNRFRFALSTKGCPDPALRQEWEQFGSQAFTLTVLEELPRKEDQTAQEYAEEIKLLLKMRLEGERE